MYQLVGLGGCIFSCHSQPGTYQIVLWSQTTANVDSEGFLHSDVRKCLEAPLHVVSILNIENVRYTSLNQIFTQALENVCAWK